MSTDVLKNGKNEGSFAAGTCSVRHVEVNLSSRKEDFIIFRKLTTYIFGIRSVLRCFERCSPNTGFSCGECINKTRQIQLMNAACHVNMQKVILILLSLLDF